MTPQKPLTERLREKLAFEENSYYHADDNYGSSGIKACQDEHERLAPYHEVMIEAVAFVYGFRYQSGPLGDNARGIIKSVETKINGK